MKIEISIINGSAKKAHQGLNAITYLKNRLTEKNIKVSIIEPSEHELNSFDKKYHKQSIDNQSKLAILAKTIDASDGFFIFTGEHFQTIPKKLKNLLDYFQKEYFFKPSAIASYKVTPIDGIKAVIHLQIVTGELGMPSVSSILPFSKNCELYNDCKKSNNLPAITSTEKFLNEFIWYAKTFKQQRHKYLQY